MCINTPDKGWIFVFSISLTDASPSFSTFAALVTLLSLQTLGLFLLLTDNLPLNHCLYSSTHASIPFFSFLEWESCTLPMDSLILSGETWLQPQWKKEINIKFIDNIKASVYSISMRFPKEFKILKDPILPELYTTFAFCLDGSRGFEVQFPWELWQGQTQRFCLTPYNERNCET